MENFVYHIPTKVFFGKGQVKNLGPEIQKYGQRVLVVSYANLSEAEKRTYAEVKRNLVDADIEMWEFQDVEANPRVSSVNAGAELCRRHNIEVLLAVGGGSVIDCAKVIAEATSYDGDAWDLVLDNSKVGDVLPVACVVTTAASGSEMDTSAVINNPDTKEKLMIFNDNARPKFSILDPTYTFSLPKFQTVAGAIDIISHVMEVYFNDTPGTDIQNYMAEGVMRAVIKNVRVVVRKPDDYNARANLLWAAGIAINGMLACGKQGDWPVHNIEHEISAYYPDVAHGAGIAAITPAWMEYVLGDETAGRLSEFAVNVCGIEPGNRIETAKAGIEYYKHLCSELGLPQSLRELGVTTEYLENMASGAVRHGVIKGFATLNYEDVLNILRNAS